MKTQEQLIKHKLFKNSNRELVNEVRKYLKSEKLDINFILKHFDNDMLVKVLDGSTNMEHYKDGSYNVILGLDASFNLIEWWKRSESDEFYTEHERHSNVENGQVTTWVVLELLNVPRIERIQNTRASRKYNVAWQFEKQKPKDLRPQCSIGGETQML